MGACLANSTLNKMTAMHCFSAGFWCYRHCWVALFLMFLGWTAGFGAQEPSFLQMEAMAKSLGPFRISQSEFQVMRLE